MDDLFVIGDFLKDMIAQERPLRILEVSEGGDEYGCLIRACQALCGISGGVVDRIALQGAEKAAGGMIYDRLLDADAWDNPDIDTYDFILILDLSGHMEPEHTRILFDALQYKITRQVLFITPLDSGAGYRKYHPVVFVGLDFSYSLIPGLGKAMQAYSVFPKIRYDEIPLDRTPTLEITEKMNIAFALPHHALTGGMKALLQQIRYLTRSGHNVNVYFRSNSAKTAIPPWSDLTDTDCGTQIVIPLSDRYPSRIKDEDIVIIGGIDQAHEFMSSKIPVALWEQGFEAIFGDFRKPLHSMSIERLNLHGQYRLPIHLLAVSEVIATTLKGIYNREAYVYPNGIDAAFYHPGEKNNDVPIILLTGHPALAFKGFRFAFEALTQAYEDGLRFQVKWAAQVKVIHGKTNFPLEVIISPSQHELAELYRSADIFLSTSLYESYALPPLEAMASGTAVIATDCGGIRAYAEHRKNCILCRQGDLSAVTDALATLLNFTDERQRLARAGRETALEHSAEKVIGLLERRLFSIVRSHNAQLANPSDMFYRH